MPDSIVNLPWIRQQDVDQIANALNNNHAVLLTGLQGIGKSRLASMLMKTLFAGSTSTENHLLVAGTHPDIHVVTSAFAYRQVDAQLQNFCFRYLDREAIEKKRLSRQIGVNTIRALVESMHQASTGGCKLTIICPVEHLNINSSNAILKFLEEPTASTFLILISHDISKLAATLRSRCMRINVPLPDKKVSAKWLASNYPRKEKNEIFGALELAGLRPLIAADYLSKNHQSLVSALEQDIAEIATNHTANIITIARKWTQYKQTDLILSWACQFFTRLIKLSMLDAYGKTKSRETQPDPAMIKSFSNESLFNTYDYLKTLNQGYDGIVDETLLMEDLLQTIAKNRK